MFRLNGFLIILLLLLNFIVYGQSTKTTHSISGRVLDSETKIQMPGAKIVLKKVQDSVIINGSITDREGNFKIDNLKVGNYRMQISFLGYKTIIKSFSIDEKNNSINIGNIELIQSSIRTSEIEVTAQRELIQTAIDKKVINVEQMAANTGGTALDLLQNVPSVDVDIDGNVSLRGNDNVKILINGRPSSMTGSEVLQQLPGSTIESIELITNPSSKFDAEGQSGVINIVLKKNQNKGINGMVSATAGTLDKYIGSINLNYRTGSFNFYTNYDTRYFRMTGTSDKNQNTIYEDLFRNLLQNEEFSRNGYSHNFKLGIDYDIDNLNSISTSVLYNNGIRKSDEKMNNIISIPNINTQTTNTRSLESYPMNSFDYILSYKHNFNKKQHDLTIDLFYMPSFRDGETNIFQSEFNNDNYINTQQLTSNNSNKQNWVLQSDYINPFSKDSKLEAGFKISNLTNRMDYEYFDIINNEYIIDKIRSNKYEYTELISAAYTSYSNAIGNFKYQVGIRIESTNQTNHYSMPQDTGTEKQYIDFFPSGFLQYDIDDFNSFQINYTRRLKRPSIRNQNPFIDYEDPLNLEKGNPDIEPEYSNNYEISHILQLKKTTFNTTLYYRQVDGAISRWQELLDTTNGITISYPKNMNKSQSLGFDCIVSHEFFKQWRADANFSYFYYNIDGSVARFDNNNKPISDSSFSSNTNSWTLKINSTINLWGIADLQITGNYRSPIASAQGIRKSSYFVDMGIKMDILDKKGTISFRVSDVFNTQKWESESYGNGIESTSSFKRTSQTAFLGFTYRFNDYKRQKEKIKSENGSDDDF